MVDNEITRKVIDFQFTRMHAQDSLQYYYQDAEIQTAKFSQWSLDHIISHLGLFNRNLYSVKWVGNDQRSYLQAFLYCLFKGCQTDLANKNGIFIKLKHAIYQLAANYLKINQQKLIVQALCALQYAKNLINFLDKNSIFLKLFDKLIRSYIQTLKIQTHINQLQALNYFSSNFDFFKFQERLQNVRLFQLFNSKFYIINQKGCYFVIQIQKKQNLIELKKVLEKQNLSLIKVINEKQKQNTEQIKTKFNQFANKVHEYAVPKFILTNNKDKIIITKQKKHPRYTQLQYQVEKIPNSRNISPKINTKTPLPNNSGKIQQLNKQGLTKQQKFYKQVPKRIKTAIIQSKLPRDKSKSNQKQQRKNHKLKKIQLNLKKVMASQKNLSILKQQRSLYNSPPQGNNNLNNFRSMQTLHSHHHPTHYTFNSQKQLSLYQNFTPQNPQNGH